MADEVSYDATSDARDGTIELVSAYVSNANTRLMHAMCRDGAEYLDRPADSTSTTTTSAKDRKLLGACASPG